MLSSIAFEFQHWRKKWLIKVLEVQCFFSFWFELEESLSLLSICNKFSSLLQMSLSLIEHHSFARYK